MVIVVTGIKRLFWWFLVYLVSDIYLLKCFSSVFWQAKEFEVLKWFVNILFCSRSRSAWVKVS